MNHCCAGLSRGVPSRSGRSKNDTSLVTICTSASDRRCDGLGHSGEIISGLEIISSTRAAGARLGPAQSPRPIQHTHDTVTRRGRAHVPARPVGDASLSRTPLPSYSVPRPAAGGRSSTGSQNMETNLSIPGRRSIMHHFNYFHLETNAMMSPYTLHVTIFETSPQKCERASHHDRTQDRTLG